MNRIKKLCKDLTKIGLSILIFTFVYYLYQIEVNTSSSEQNIQILSGQSANSIAQELHAKEIIDSPTAFKIYLKITKQTGQINTGTFSIPANANIRKITEIITSNQVIQQRFTIQEGLTIEQIDQKLAQEGLITNGQFISSSQNFQDWDKYPFLTKNNNPNPLEGYIYPDTYFLSGNFTPQELIEKALQNFSQKTQGLNLQYQDLILASIIENEVRATKDRQKVADIFLRRLEANWRLDADITVVYITGNRQITASDLQIDSPYNTRKNPGLPPGPISNPSIDSITATLNPISNNFWFYLTTLDTGEVIYAETNEQHSANKFTYL